MPGNKAGVKRRGFFSAVAVGGAASLVSSPETATAQPVPSAVIGRDIQAYLASIPQPPPLMDIPLLAP